MALTVIKALVLAVKNLVAECLALSVSSFLKDFQTYYYQRVADKIIKEKEELGCNWQDPPEDVKEMIVKRMSFSGRVRLSSLCKSWRSASARRDIQTCPQLPWLVHPQEARCHSLSFSSILEGRVFKLRMPCPDFKSKLDKLVWKGNPTSYLLESSRGWLVIGNWEVYFRIKIYTELVLFLVNPVSGTQHRLPPLKTIPCYREDTDNSRPNDVVLSSPDVSKCIVAANLGKRKLILCRPGDKSWSVFQVFDEEDIHGCIQQILFSSTTGVLYALVKGSSNCGDDACWTENRSLMFGDDEVTLKVIYDKTEWWIDSGIFIQQGNYCRPYLSESTNNELLLIYQIQGPDVDDEDAMEDLVAEDVNNDEIEDNEQNVSVLGRLGKILLRIGMQLKSFFNHHQKEESGYMGIRSFRVYKFDQDSNNFLRVQDIGDQMLFLAEDNSSLSLLASDFKGLRGNCIYFATRGREFGTLHTSREIGIFYLDTGKIERSFPSLELQYSALSWLMPSLWWSGRH